MRVKVLCTLKAEKLISEGTIFEGDEDTLPNFILSELKQNRGTIEILPDPEPEKKKKKVKSVAPANKSSNGPKKKKPASLREKLSKTEK